MNCPKCHSEIPNNQINISADIAQCVNCNNVFKISENITTKVSRLFDKNDPPAGAWMKSDFNTMTLGATARSWFALFIVPFALVWTSFSWGGLYGTQFASGEFNLFTSLFGIPFLIGGIAVISMAAMFTFGKVEITLDTEGGKIFTGVGIIGRNQRFKWDEISSISEETTYNNKGTARSDIVLEGKTRISFGSMLNDERRYYILKALQQVFSKKEMNSGFI